MDIRQLKYFLAITDEGGISAAARHLNMSQPPLTNQLKMLEDELGVTLFERENKRLILTESGRILYQQAQKLAKDFDKTLALFNDLKNGLKGSLTIGCTCSLSILYMPTIMKDFLYANPDIDLSMHEANTDLLLKMLDNDEIELAIMKQEVNRELYHCIQIDSLLNLEEDCLVAVGLPDFFEQTTTNIPFTEIRRKPLLIQNAHVDLIKNTCSLSGFAPHIFSTHDNVLTALHWCMDGLGIAILPLSACKLLDTLKYTGEELQIHKLIDPVVPSPTNLIWKRHQLLGPIAENFLDNIKYRLKLASKNI